MGVGQRDEESSKKWTLCGSFTMSRDSAVIQSSVFIFTAFLYQGWLLDLMVSPKTWKSCRITSTSLPKSSKGRRCRVCNWAFKSKNWIKNPTCCSRLLSSLLNLCFFPYSTELSGSGGTQVNVTCIVKVCNPDCGSQLDQSVLETSMDYGSAQCSPTGGEVLLSKEEKPLKKETEIQILVEAKDNLLQDLLLDAKKFPLSVQDMGMKTV